MASLDMLLIVGTFLLPINGGCGEVGDGRGSNDSDTDTNTDDLDGESDDNNGEDDEQEGIHVIPTSAPLPLSLCHGRRPAVDHVYR